MHSLPGSREKNLEFQLKRFAHIVVIQSYKIFTVEQSKKKNNCIKIENGNGPAFCHVSAAVLLKMN